MLLNHVDLCFFFSPFSFDELFKNAYFMHNMLLIIIDEYISVWELFFFFLSYFFFSYQSIFISNIIKKKARQRKMGTFLFHSNICLTSFLVSHGNLELDLQLVQCVLYMCALCACCVRVGFFFFLRFLWLHFTHNKYA